MLFSYHLLYFCTALSLIIMLSSHYHHHKSKTFSQLTQCPFTGTLLLLCFAIFTKNSNGRHFWWDKNFSKFGQPLSRVSLRFKNFVDMALFSTDFEIQAFLCFAIFAKNSKIQNGRHFWIDKNFWKLGQLLRRVTLWVKILLKLLCLARFSRDKHFCVLHFWKKFENSKSPPFLASAIFIETWKG